MKQHVQGPLRTRLPGLSQVARNDLRLWMATDNDLSVVLRGVDVEEWISSLRKQHISFDEILFNLGIPPHESVPPCEYEAMVREALCLIANEYPPSEATEE